MAIYYAAPPATPLARGGPPRYPSGMRAFHGTTVLCVRREGRVVMASDGQVTLDKTVMKATARKVRRLAEGQVLAGFAGATADAFQLFELFEKKLKEYARSLPRASVELAKQSLDQTGRNPRTSSDYKNLELKTRALLKKLGNLVESMSFQEREDSKPMLDRVQTIHDDTLMAIMEGQKKKGKK